VNSYLIGLRCVTCGAATSDLTRDPLCPACGGFLQAEYDLDKVRAEVDRDALAAQPRGMWRWSCLLPVRDERHVVTLQEGDTPLLRMERLGQEFGCPGFFIKDESRNPSGSFKDRGACVTVSKCREVGIERLVIASSGNASAALSTYCARAGLQLTALMRPETVPGHLLQSLICGTDALVVDGDMVEGTRLAQQAADRYGWFHATQPYNLYRIEGKKTLAFEIAEALGWRAPDRILIPTGGGTNVLALELGFRQLNAIGWISGMPALDVIQSTGCAPLVRAWERDEPVRHWGRSTARATGMTHPFPRAGDEVVAIMRRTGGRGWAVSDADSFAAARRLAQCEGLFLQPAAAASAAGLMTGKLEELDGRENGTGGRPLAEQVVVGIGTGSGKNQVAAALAELPEPPRIPPELAALEAALSR
jgi:threonine synthase